MDARALDFPDDTFDGVYSSGSIEHFGSLEYVASASFEIGRVLRPGGIATIATEFKVAGPPESNGWDPNVILFSPEKLKKYIVSASGLELVDPLNIEISDGTLAVQRDLLSFLEGTRGAISAVKKIAQYPNLILYHEGYLFCSVHLALRKPSAYPVVDNSWAAPSAETRSKVAISHADTTSYLGGSLLDLLGHRRQDHDVAWMRERISVLSDAYNTQQAEISQLRQHANRMEADCHHWANAYREMQASMSWRITAPLRKVVRPIYEARKRRE
jgi:hypothetical protein